MKKLLETLYILTPESYVYHRNENICLCIGGEEKASIPVTQIESIVFFGKNSLSTSLLSFCSRHDVTITFVSESGFFEGRLCGPVSGNVLLRKRQYESMNDPAFSKHFVRNLLYGKIHNSREVLMRCARSAKGKDNASELIQAAAALGELAVRLDTCGDLDSMRGVEGAASSAYFRQFDRMLLPSCGFRFEMRTRRPPRNEVNAVLSFVYTMLAHDMRSALETVGLDPAAGYLHTLRPGRSSFALDLMEDMRAPLCDRFVLLLFNKGQLEKNDFETDSQAVYLNEKGRKTVLSQWVARKREEIQHPFFHEKIPIGLIPYTQAIIRSR